MKSNIKAIIFDLDETLVIGEQSAIDAFMEVCRLAETRCGVETTKLYSAIRQESRALWQNSPARQYCLRLGLSSWEGLCSSFDGDDPNLSILREWSLQYRIDSWNTALVKRGITDRNLAILLADTFYHRARENYRLYPDVIPCLDHYAKKCRLALLTDGTSDLQREKITTTGIAKYFAEVIVSCEVGYGKPEPQIFEILLSRLNIDASSAWMIGDSLERDIKGAKALGMKTVWVNRHGLSRDESIVPDMEVSNLGQLVDTHGKLTSSSNHLL